VIVLTVDLAGGHPTAKNLISGRRGWISGKCSALPSERLTRAMHKEGLEQARGDTPNSLRGSRCSLASTCPRSPATHPIEHGLGLRKSDCADTMTVKLFPEKALFTRERRASFAVEHGVDGLMVSNHGGRAEKETLRSTIEKALPRGN